MYVIALLHLLVLLLSIWIVFLGLKSRSPMGVVVMMLIGMVLLLLNGYSFMMFLETLRN